MKLTKGPLKAIIGGAAFLVCGVTALSTFVPSYRAYKEYYDAKMEEKRLNSLPLELLSIEANQIKDIYATGFDLPEKDDFEVKANFTDRSFWIYPFRKKNTVRIFFFNCAHKFFPNPFISGISISRKTISQSILLTF